MPDITLRWCHDHGMLEPLARFFAANVTTSYISHSELQTGRALTPTQWNPDIERIFRDEMALRLSQPAGGALRVAVAQRDGSLVGLAYVTFTKEVPRPFIILEDIVVHRAIRGGGIGQAIVDWVLAAARGEGIVRAFLESGASNHDAHDFFERNGFHQTSIVMMADLGDEPA